MKFCKNKVSLYKFAVKTLVCEKGRQNEIFCLPLFRGKVRLYLGSLVLFNLFRLKLVEKNILPGVTTTMMKIANRL